MTKKEQKTFLDVMVDTMATEGAKRLSERMVTSYLPKDIEAFMREKLRAEAEREIYNVLNTVKQRFKSAATVGVNMLRPRKEVLAACKVLQVLPPKLGKPVDLMAAAKNRKAQMKLYHPDVSPDTRDEFEAAVKAYSVLAAYNAALEVPPNGI